MIKINLLAERRPTKKSKAPSSAGPGARDRGGRRGEKGTLAPALGGVN